MNMARPPFAHAGNGLPPAVKKGARPRPQDSRRPSVDAEDDFSRTELGLGVGLADPTGARFE
jgi:hypothetical protein